MPDNAPQSHAPLSLSRLRDAFATMLSGGDTEYDVASNRPGDDQPSRQHIPGEISPRSIIEAMLFVGRPDNGSFSARELAAAMRGVSLAEVDAAVRELNATYDRDQSPYRIEGTVAGYRLALREEFERMRDKLRRRVREAKLSPATIEVLSLIAYNQPITASRIAELRGSSSGSAISMLVRRGLVRVERSGSAVPSQYWTTDRFLKIFRLENLAALPRSEELDKA